MGQGAQYKCSECNFEIEANDGICRRSPNPIHFANMFPDERRHELIDIITNDKLRSETLRKRNFIIKFFDRLFRNIFQEDPLICGKFFMYVVRNKITNEIINKDYFSLYRYPDSPVSKADKVIPEKLFETDYINHETQTEYERIDATKLSDYPCPKCGNKTLVQGIRIFWD